MRILLVHNYYRQAGGEDRVFHAEAEVLRAHGHDVVQYTRTNEDIEGRGGLSLALETIWSSRSRRELADVIRQTRPDVAHFHNTLPLVSPAGYYACRAARVPIVQTLHNFRLNCPKATYFRDGRVCEDCRPRLLAWPGVVHACYRGSRTATASIAAMTALHRAVGTWRRAVDRFVVPSAFTRTKMIEGGLAPEKVVVKPHFVSPDPGPGSHRGGFAVFVGRLSSEKGLGTLLSAWQKLPHLRLNIVGDGPLREQVTRAAGAMPGVAYLGPRSRAETLELIGDATLLVFPSEWYETFGLVVVEALARGTPVVAADLGGVRELVEPNRTGLLFEPGNAGQLAEQVNRASDLPSMRAAARRAYEQQFTAERGYELLMNVYADVGAGR